MNDVSNCRVLVTGGGGFVGSHLTSALAVDNHVQVLDNFSTGRRANLPEDVTVIEGDIRDTGTVSKAMDYVDIVFHEAAMVSVPESIEQPVDCHELNGSATVTVLDCARRQDARVVLASSAAVYGNPDTVPIREAEPADPRTPYGIEKHLGEQYAQFYTERYGLPTVPLRYFNVYGPRGLTGSTPVSSAPSSGRRRRATRSQSRVTGNRREISSTSMMSYVQTCLQLQRMLSAGRSTSELDEVSLSTNSPKPSEMSLERMWG